MMAVAGLLSYLADAIAGAAADKGGGDHDARKRMGDALRRCRDAKSLEGTAKQIGQGPKGAARAVDLKALLPERKVDPQNLFMSLRWHSTKYLCLSLKCSYDGETFLFAAAIPSSVWPIRSLGTRTRTPPPEMSPPRPSPSAKSLPLRKVRRLSSRTKCKRV